MRRGLSAAAEAIWGDPEAAEEAEAAAAAQLAKARSRKDYCTPPQCWTPISSWSTNTPQDTDDEEAVAVELVQRAMATALGEKPPARRAMSTPISAPASFMTTTSSAPGSFNKKRRGRVLSPTPTDGFGGEATVRFRVGVHDQLISSSKPSLNPKFSPVTHLTDDPVCVALCRCLRDIFR